jgi:hypothetical protein
MGTKDIIPNNFNFFNQGKLLKKTSLIPPQLTTRTGTGAPHKNKIISIDEKIFIQFSFNNIM